LELFILKKGTEIDKIGINQIEINKFDVELTK